MRTVLNTRRPVRQPACSPLFPSTRPPPRAVRAKVAIVNQGGSVLAVVSTVAEARLLLATEGRF
jgi:hypothetical protein